MHIAIMEPTDPRATAKVAALCAEQGTSLHLIGPMEIGTAELEAQEAAGQLDLWLHPDWFEFRRAIARERCYYFTPDGTKEVSESRLRPTSVLMFAGAGELPARIKEKYPHRLYKLPAGNWTDAVRSVVEEAAAKVGGHATGGGLQASEKPRGRRPSRPRR